MFNIYDGPQSPEDFTGYFGTMATVLHVWEFGSGIDIENYKIEPKQRWIWSPVSTKCEFNGSIPLSSHLPAISLLENNSN